MEPLDLAGVDLIMSTGFTRLAGLLGVLAPIFTLTLIFVSVAVSPRFDRHNNALSDMGISRTPSPFNVALLIGGAMYSVFVPGFLRWQGTSSTLNKIALHDRLCAAQALCRPRDSGRCRHRRVDAVLWRKDAVRS